MNLYTEAQVKRLLKEQRRMCEAAAIWHTYPGTKMFHEGQMEKAPEPDLPKPFEPRINITAEKARGYFIEQ